MKRKREVKRELVLRRIELVKNELARREREASTLDSILKSTFSEQKETEPIGSILKNPEDPVLTTVPGAYPSTEPLKPDIIAPKPKVDTGDKVPLPTEAKVPYWVQEEILTGMEKLEGDSYYVATGIIQEHFDDKLGDDSEIDIEQLPPACVNKLITYIRHTLKTQMKGIEESKENEITSERISEPGEVVVDSKLATTKDELEQTERSTGGKTIMHEDKPKVHQSPRAASGKKVADEAASGKEFADKAASGKKVADEAASGKKIADETEYSKETVSNKS